MKNFKKERAEARKKAKELVRQDDSYGKSLSAEI